MPLLWHFDGAAWTAVEGSPTDGYDDGILFGNDSEVVVVGEATATFKAFTYDGSAVVEDIAAGGRIVDADTMPDGTYIVVTDLGGILRGNVDGWTTEPPLVEQRLTTVAADASGNAWVGGVVGSLLRTAR